MNKKESLEINFILKEIKVRKFNLIELQDDKTEISSGKVSLNIGLRIDEEKELIIILLSVSIIGSEDTKNDLCSANFEFHYHVFDLKKIPIEGKKIALPKDFVEMLTGISFSTARGILFEKLSSSFLRRFILPVIDTKKIAPMGIDKID